MDMFEYIAVLTSIIIGLGIAHLLRGVVSVIQQSDRHRPYWVHLLWVLNLFFNLVFWWWWEFRLGTIETWTLPIYLFVILYAVVLFLACAMMFPTNMEDFDGYRGYFYARRKWFFGLIGVLFFIDVGDTAIKGGDYISSLGVEYLALTLLQAGLCFAAMFIRSERFHALFAVLMLAYLVSWALRQFAVVAV
ncbi:hypothetical protein F3N42_00565 [Marinihelvus fidelis]|uniref:Transmembrane protein n=1 Tax=Marinihelvus fidelis TaxID=2613842 RepID=A0A5N0TJJ5_9GAMM|nr:hypothetical protein [Marinihelvus fidelis]KAA9134076.1 hypothetical protein F3N42_00565 [Marinihelvus fidelis]